MAERMPRETLGRHLLTTALILGLGTDILQPLFAYTAGGVSDVPEIDAAILTVVGVLIRLTVVILLFFETYKGRVWARWVLAAFYFASALKPFFSTGAATWQDAIAAWGDLAWPVYSAIALYLLIGFLLVSAPAIGAYQADARAKAEGKGAGPGIE